MIQPSKKRSSNQNHLTHPVSKISKVRVLTKILRSKIRKLMSRKIWNKTNKKNFKSIKTKQLRNRTNLIRSWNRVNLLQFRMNKTRLNRPTR